jgi:5'-nucleotidase
VTAAARAFAPPPERGVFCNRTLNMRAIQVVGFDMDYTLVHYDVEAWEARAYAHVQQRLAERGLPVAGLTFDPLAFSRGLVLDVERGNVVKANRFGYVTRAAHGMALLPHEQQREVYSQVWVDLSDPRWVFLNTLFSLSEVCLYAQLVELLDAGSLPSALGYAGVYPLVRDAMNAAHLEGQLKAEVIADPERFVVLDPDLPRTLLDLREAGKRLLLVTNSEWDYTRAMMSYTFDRYLEGAGFRSLFDLVIVQARKPEFFEAKAPCFEVLEDSGQLRPYNGPLVGGRAYHGGHARLVEQSMGVSGEEILYVGDHVYADVHVSSAALRWRTALVLREIEEEVALAHAFAAEQVELDRAMSAKAELEREQSALRLSLQRLEHGQAPLPGLPQRREPIQARLRELRTELDALDHTIAPLARRGGELGNARWGPLLRAGNDKSRLARQIERYADVYTSRVSNLLYLTPFGYLRAPRGSLPHDP